MRWSFALGMLLLAACVQQQPLQQEQSLEPQIIIALGDSLTAGSGVPPNQTYPAQLERLLRDQGYEYQVINMGRNGETSFGTLERIDEVIAQEPDIVIVAVGANDALRLFDPAVTKENLDRIVSTLVERNISIVLAGSPVVRVSGWDYPERFTSIHADVAQQHNVTYMPFFLQGVVGSAELNLEDGYHPNAAGYAVIAKNMLPYVINATTS